MIKYFSFILFFLLCASSVQSYAVECSVLFPDGIQNSDAGGSIKFNWDARVLNSPDNILDTQNLQDGSGGVSCDSLACSASNTLVPTVNFAAFPGGSNISVGYQGTLTLSPGDYGKLTLSSEATLLLEPGVYTFSGKISFGSDSVVEVSTAGAVDLFANNQVSFNNQVSINSIGGDHYFTLYSNQQITLVSSTVYRGLIYGRGKVTIQSNVDLTGAVTAEGKIELISGARVSYDPSVFGGGICELESGVDHYAISVNGLGDYTDGSGLTCQASTITIEGHDSSGVAVAPGSTILLSTSTGAGYWSSASAGTLTDLGGGDASYEFAANSFVDLQFNHTVPALNPNPVNFDINAGTSDPTEDAAEDPDLQIFDTGFRFVDGSDDPLPNQVAGLASSTVYLQAVRKDNDTGSCTALFADGTTHSVGIGAQCNNPSSCAGEQVNISNNGSALDVVTNDNAVFGYSNFPALLFGADSKAALTLNYPDAGAISLHAKHDILNDDGADSLVDLLGSSNTFVVKPYTLFVSDVPGNLGTTSTGTGFTAAGADFTVEVEARNAQGNRTPNFGNESTAEGIILTLPAGALIYPAGGVVGSLNNAASFSAVSPAGTFQNTAVQWTEVGTVQLQPHLADGDYLGAGPLNSGDGSIWSTSGNIGRFYPDHFRLVSSTLENACAAGNFSYMSEPLSISYNLQAESALSNAVVTNYDVADGWINPAAISYQAENGDDGVERNIANRVFITTPDWSGGVIALSASSASFLRQTGSNPEDGPFMDLDVGLQLTDTVDSRLLQGLDMKADSSNDCVVAGDCTAKQLGSPLRAYFGRMHLKDAFGPETAAIPMFWQNEIWNGSQFILNSADSCTALPVLSITFADSAAADDTLDTIAVTKGGISSNFQFNDIVDTGGVEEVIFSNGLAGTVYGAPSPTSTVSYVLGVDFNGLDYLSGDWDENGIYGGEDHPNITVNFLHYRGNDRVIYWRELLQ